MQQTAGGNYYGVDELHLVYITLEHRSVSVITILQAVDG
jgi:hypothetical protein